MFEFQIPPIGFFAKKAAFVGIAKMGGVGPGFVWDYEDFSSVFSADSVLEI